MIKHSSTPLEKFYYIIHSLSINKFITKFLHNIFILERYIISNKYKIVNPFFEICNIFILFEYCSKKLKMGDIMCGIAGYIGFEGENAAENIKKSLKRRGPDQDGIVCLGDAVLIHTRLAVIDVEHGLQPMQGGNFTLVYNGELYNTEELRKELQSLGETFTENSDTEVVLKSYIHWGDKCAEHMNGIFAFAVWDGEKLFFARDRFGVKPFFYANIDGKFIFSSEIKGILESGFVKSEIDNNSLAELILIGPGRTPGYGVFKNIRELPPASCGYFQNGILKIRQYWELKSRRHTDSFKQTVDTVRFLLIDSINRQTVSDVPLCTFLSGGIDNKKIYILNTKKLPFFRINNNEFLMCFPA